MPEERTGKRVAPNEEWIQVRLPKDVKAWLTDMAARRDRSVSYLIRNLVLRAHETSEQFKDPEE